MENTDLFQLFVSIPAFFINILALFLLIRSKKLPYQIRILSLNLCTADSLSCLFLSLERSVFELITGIKFVKYFFVLISAQTSLIIVTCFNLDRYLAFKFAMKYYTFLSSTKVKMTCALAWTIGPLITCLQFCSVSSAKFCETINYKVSTRISEYFFFLIFISNFLMFPYIMYKIKTCISRVEPTSQMQPREKSSRNQTTGQRTFKKVVVITGTFLGLYAPGMAWTLIKPYVANPQVINNINIGTGIFFTIAIILDPIFYVLRFSECRFQILLLRYKCNTKKYEEVLKKRNRHYATYEMETSLSHPVQEWQNRTLLLIDIFSSLCGKGLSGGLFTLAPKCPASWMSKHSRNRPNSTMTCYNYLCSLLSYTNFMTYNILIFSV